MLVITLTAAVGLGRLGANFGEALYVSLSMLIVLSYAMTSWRLRKGR
ncbi:MAG TPA: hypothetical protein VHP83_23755 [Aggregatilineaceae bacterium]|nr:hypothetical protein [Aggregatilineaceae bacterium]